MDFHGYLWMFMDFYGFFNGLFRVFLPSFTADISGQKPWTWDWLADDKEHQGTPGLLDSSFLPNLEHVQVQRTQL